MEKPPKDPPLEPYPESTPRWAADVIDLGEMRIKFGLTKPPNKKCEHRSLIYSTEERRVWCEDCERTIDGFDAFMAMVRDFHRMVTALERKRTALEEAISHNVIARAAKAVDQVWRGRRMVPCCPHCRQGLLPEDFANGVGDTVSAELERQRRKAKGGKK